MKCPAVCLLIAAGGLAATAVVAAPTPEDCDQNGLLDLDEIAATPALDCNGDGILDLCQGPAARLSLLEGDLPLAANPSAFLAVDLDLDGAGDLVSLESTEGLSQVTVLRSGADATFAPAKPVRVGTGFSTLVAHRRGADGPVDLIAGSADALVRLENPGDGLLREATPFAPAGATALASADLDGDGSPELLSLARSDRTLTVYPGALDPGQSLAPVAVGESAAGLAAGDFDADGTLDVVVLRGTTDDVLRLPGRGDGTFGEPAPTLLGISGPFLLDVADISGDGNPDLAVGSIRGLVWLEATQEGFNAPVELGAGGRLTSFLLEDFDADGHRDLVQATTLTSEVRVRRNLGGGRFLANVPYAVGWAPRRLVRGDFDADGDFDLAAVVGDATRARVSMLFAAEPLPPGDTVFDTAVVRVTGKPHGIATADFNADGYADAATGNGSQGSFSVLFGDAAGDLEMHRTYVPRERATLFSVAAGDWDGDGDTDLAASDIISSQLLVRPNAGDGTFFDVSFYSTGSAPSYLTTLDYDQDGALDFVTANEFADSITLLRNLGDGTWEGPVELRAASRPVAVAPADLDGDGVTDLAVSSLNAREVSLLWGAGDGTFERGPVHPVFEPPRFVAAADLDQNGKHELVVAQGSLVSILRQETAGVFVESRVLETRQAPYSLLITDLDGDTRLDIVTSNTTHRTYGTLSVFLARGALDFERPFRFVSGAEPRYAVATDIEGDGDMDLITGNRTSETITRLRQDQVVEIPAKDCEVAVEFRRGDVNGDGRLNLVDPVRLASSLFGPSSVPCAKSADADDSGVLEITDVIVLLDHLFRSGPPPAPPAGGCGTDATPDTLGCTAHACD